MTTRRQLLLGAAGLALAGCGAEPKGPKAGFVEGYLTSASVPGQVGWALSRPTAGTLPLMLVLHGRGGDHISAFGELHLDEALRTAVRAGTRPFAIASVDGGHDSYYHPRADGTNALRMVLDDLLPVLAQHGVRTDRFAVGGWSMGGFGALLMAEVLGPARIQAVAVDSPALYLSAGSTAAGAFDSPADFRKHDVLTRTGLLRGVPLRVTCGLSDPFVAGTRKLLAEVPTAEQDLRPGGHTVEFWRASAPGQLAFVGKHLS